MWHHPKFAAVNYLFHCNVAVSYLVRGVIHHGLVLLTKIHGMVSLSMSSWYCSSFSIKITHGWCCHQCDMLLFYLFHNRGVVGSSWYCSSFFNQNYPWMVLSSMSSWWSESLLAPLKMLLFSTY